MILCLLLMFVLIRFDRGRRLVLLICCGLLLCLVRVLLFIGLMVGRLVWVHRSRGCRSCGRVRLKLGRLLCWLEWW